MQSIQSLRFGDITIKKSSIFTFPDGVLGFQNLRNFALINHKQDDIFLYLQSTEQPCICFPVIDNAATKRERILSIVTIPNDPTQMTANLKAPIVLDLNTMQGRQVVLKDPDLPIRQPIFDYIRSIVIDQKKIFKDESLNLDLCNEVTT